MTSNFSRFGEANSAFIIQNYSLLNSKVGSIIPSFAVVICLITPLLKTK